MKQHQPKPSQRTSRNDRRPNRRGASLVMVLTLLTITLGLSYAMLRTQVTEATIQRNYARRQSARSVALTAASVALRRMHSVSWLGADSSFSGNLSATESYWIQYQTGDSDLQATSPDWHEYPYRVTVTVVGAVQDPENVQSISKYKIRFVTTLVRNQIQPAPDEWAPTATATLVQTAATTTYFNLPLQIKGKCEIHGYDSLSNFAPTSTAARNRILSDLQAMFEADLGDHRPFNDTYEYSRWNVVANTLSSLLNLEVNQIPTASNAGVSLPAMSDYQLYPGGKSYDIEVNHSNDIQDFTFHADPLTNPLGVIRFSSSIVRFKDSVDIIGTVLGSTVIFDGQGTSFRSPTLRYTQTMRLPSVVANGNLYVDGDADGTVDGSVVSFNLMQWHSRTTTEVFDFRGPILTGRFQHRGNDNWNALNSEQWDALLAEFQQQLTLPDITPITYFPVWLKENQGLNYESTIRLERGPDNVIHHWHDWTKPVYDADPQDGELRWDLIQWDDIGPF